MLNIFPHSPPSHSLSLIYTKKRKSTRVLRSQQELKYAVLIALSLVTSAADQTNVDRSNYSVSVVQLNSQRFDLQPCWLIFFVSLLLVNRTTLLCRVNNVYSSTVSPDLIHTLLQPLLYFFFYPSCLVVTSLIPDPPSLSFLWIIPPFPSVSFVKASSTCTRSL